MNRIHGIALALVVVMAVALPAPVVGSQVFPDVPPEMAEITGILAGLGILRGWDGLFWPGEQLTREQLATVVVRLARLDGKLSANTGREASMYIDAPAPDHWSTPYLIVAFETGLMRGYRTAEGRVIDPRGTVSFDDTITVVLRALSYETSEMKTDWPGAYRNKALALGLIDPATYARAGSAATRGEIASVVGAAVLDVPKADGTYLFPTGETPTEATPPPGTITYLLGQEVPAGDPHLEAIMVDLVNDERIERGLKPLAVDPVLTALARLKSQDLVDNDYFAHHSPIYGSPFDMMLAAGVSFTSAAENLGTSRPGDIHRIHQGLMDSEGHRNNILSPYLTHLGIGAMATYQGGLMVTQMFIGR